MDQRYAATLIGTTKTRRLPLLTSTKSEYYSAKIISSAILSSQLSRIWVTGVEGSEGSELQ